MTDRERRLDHLSPEKRRLLQRRLAARRDEQASRPDAAGPRRHELRPRPDGEAPAPLGSAQERFWFLHQLEPDSDEYNLTGAGRLSGTLDREALAAALSAIVARQAVLRTSFPNEDGRPVQRVHAAAPVPLPLEDLSHLPADARREAALARARSFGAEPFDLATGPLFTALLLRLHEQEHVLLVNQHHAVSDGWSLSLLMRELAAFYNGALRGAPPEGLPELSVTYADVCAWARRALSGPALDARLATWHALLDGAPSAVDLPCDRPRPALATHAGATHHVTLSPGSTAALRALARAQSATLFSALLGLFGAWLRRLSASHDVVLGSSHANRDRREVEGLMGPFVNTIALRLAGAADDDLEAVVGQAREAVRAALAVPDLPFETLVEALSPERDRSRTPLFNVFFDMPVPLPPVRFDGLEVETLEFERGRALFDLSLAAVDRGDTLKLAFETNSDLFDAGTAAWMARAFTLFVDAALAHPRLPVTRLPLLTADERAAALELGRGPRLPLPTPALVHERAAICAANEPEAPALWQDGVVMSRGELHARARGLAARLAALGVGPDVPVAVCLPRSAEVLVTALAIWKAGGCYLPLDAHDPPERLASVFEDARPAVIVSVSSLTSALPSCDAARLLLDAPSADDPARDDDTSHDTARHASRDAGHDAAALPTARPEHLAYVIFTSGSTGRPKGVAVSHGALANHLVATAAFLALGPDDRVLLRTPASFDAALWELVHPLVTGAQLVVAPPGLQRDPAALLGLVAEAGITVLQTVPSMLSTWLDEPALDRCHALRHLICAGEPLRRELVQRWGDACSRAGLRPALHNLYGPSEATIDACAHTCPRDGSGRLVSPARETLPIGRPLANMSAHVLDVAGHPAPAGVVGELWLGGAGLARGYLGRPELSAERFVPGLLGEQRLYRTGDLARRLPDGELEHVGRVDDQVKLSGHRVELGEVEAALARHPDVAAAAAAVHAERLVGYVVPRADTALDTAALSAWLAGYLPRSMRPSALVRLEALPLTSSEKLDRAALPAPGPTAAAAGEPPRPGLETQLAGLFEQLLGVTGVNRGDDFFALGGHSLLAARLATRVRQELGRPMSLLAFFEAPCVGSLAAALEAEPPDAGPEPLPRDGALLPASPGQERLWFLDRLEPGSVHYAMTGALRLTGALDPTHLSGALDALVARHESLRTTFEPRDGRPWARVHPAAPLPLPLVQPDPGEPGAEGEQGEACVQRVLGELARTPFDLAEGPLLRARLVRLGPEHHVLATSVHHALADAVSLQLMLRDVARALHALRAGRAPDLPALPLQPADVFAWSAARRDPLERQLAFWQQRLEGRPDELPLPTDRPRPELPRHRGRALGRDLTPAAAAAVPALAARLGVTPFAVVLAACGALLQRLSAQDELALGTTVSGRSAPGSEELVGLFVNALPLPLDASGAPTFAELARRAQALTLQALAHQELPFERIVAACATSRQAGRPPLFNVAVDLLPSSLVEVDVEGLTLEELPFDPGTSKLDLAFSFEPRGEGLRLRTEYDRDLWDQGTIADWCARLERLLAAAGATPDAPVGALDWLHPGEAERLWAGDRGEELEFDGRATPWARFVAHAERGPGAPALRWDGGTRTRGELLARADASARALRARGVGPDVVVAVDVPRGPELAESLLAVWRAGGAIMPLDPGDPPARRAELLDRAGARLVLGTADAQQSPRPSPGPSPEPTRDPTREPSPGASPEPPAEHPSPARYELAALRAEGQALDGALPARSPGHLAWVLLTSGSSGRPKAVAVEDRSVAWHAAAMQRVMPLDADDRVLCHIPPSFDAALLELGLALASGACMVPAPEHEQADARALVERMARHGVSVVAAVPALLQRLLREPRLGRCDALRLVLCGGEAMPADLPALARAVSPRPERPLDLFNLYGPTEATIDALAARCGADAGAGGVVPVGRPLPGARCLVLDAEGRPQPDGVAGELALGGPGLLRGYLGDADATAAACCEAPDGERLYRSGDRARRLPDGSFVLLGRMDRQVKIAGRRTEPAEIEARLSEHPAVHEASVVTLKGGDGALRLVAWAGVATHDAATHDAAARAGASAVSGDELLSHLRARLPRGLVPAAVQVCPALPRTARGKPDLPALRRLSAAPARPGEPPAGPTERRLAGVVGELLDAREVGRQDDLFSLGLHSLLAVDLVAAVQADFGRELPLRAVFERPTVAGLGALLDALDGGAPPEVALRPAVTPDLAALTRLPEDVSPRGPRRPSHPPRRVLLTGATGFLGAHLLGELLRRGVPQVLALVRAPDAAAGRARVAAALQRYGLPPLPDAGERVVIVPGDLERPDLGLGPTSPLRAGPGAHPGSGAGESTGPQPELDLVLHCGARVDFLQPYERLAPANVGSTLALLRLACRAGGAPLHLVSTLGVLMAPAVSARARLDEDLPLDQLVGVEGGYEQSKWAAERLCAQAAERGLPLGVHRPGRVAASAITGACHPDDAATRFLRGCLALGAYPDLDAPVDVSPVDHVAASIVALALADARGTFHHVHPRPTPSDALFLRARERGRELAALPFEAWSERARAAAARSPEHPLAPILPMLESAEAVVPDLALPPVGTGITRAALGSRAAAAPAIDAAYLDRWLDALGR